MEFESLNRRLQERYPMCFVKWSPERRLAEVWEKYRGKVGDMTRHLWTYENPDGSRLPVEFAVILEWLQKADTRNWSMARRNLFRDIVDTREKARKKAEEDVREAITTRIVEDYNYIAGIPTFFMDPKSMPEARAKLMPGQEKILKQNGMT
jgi:hypothetical protein